ncbi:hypothetical protein GCM10009619_35890 [Williamsia maris]|uniref:Uncharacterized protein n=2 Tax=Williamsia maris TaxID=72806 RepID=A0ABT1HFJ1_9NOCA|nr:hypothetical protein [Williamsia maris]
MGVVTVADESLEGPFRVVGPVNSTDFANEMEITMQLDCGTCPGRPRACDGCMMTVFFAAPTTRNGADGPIGVDASAAREADRLHVAIDAFVAAGMVGASAHDLPIVREHGGQGVEGHENVRRLRAS